MWTTENRPRHNRDRLRYPSDLTNEEWALVEPLIPPGKRGGGKRRVVMREVVNRRGAFWSTRRDCSRTASSPPPTFRIATAASPLLATLFDLFPYLEKSLADSAYGGPVFRVALASVLPHPKIEIVKHADYIKGFVALPKQWIVERTIAWLHPRRRLATDWETVNCNALAFLKLASIRRMLRKLCKPG